MQAEPKHGAPSPGFMVVHGNRLEDLRDLLTQVLRTQPLAPLQREVVLVQSNGMKHWLELALARGLGICAATDMLLPAAFLWQAYRAVLGPAAVPAQLPFDKTRLLWRLVRMLPEWLQARAEAPDGGADLQAPLRAYLHGRVDPADPGTGGPTDDTGRRLLQLAQQVADLFDGYQSHRSDWLADWAAGHDRLRDPATGQAQPVPADQSWQPALWRHLLADVLAHPGQGDPAGQAPAAGPGARSRDAVHTRFVQALSRWQGPPPAGLPPRVVVFGISSLPLQAVEALAALGRVVQVLMLVQNPCRHHWADVVDEQTRLRRLAGQRQWPKPAEPGAPPHGHPLLAAWGRQGRDHLHLLDTFDDAPAYRDRWLARGVRVDAFVCPAQAARDAGRQPTLLERVQAAILDLDAAPDPGSDRPPGRGDGSITFACAHSPRREVEVLHDQLRHWLETDPGLQPGDITVMVPDMAAFAPHIHAVFGRHAPGEPAHIPYSVADQTPRESPVARALEALLSLPATRLTLSDALALLEVDVVRQRFELTEADVLALHTLLGQAGVRWGLDSAHRQALGLDGGAEAAHPNTWAFGLERLLLGYAVSSPVAPALAWQGVLPQPGWRGLDAPLASRLLDWLASVRWAMAHLQAARTPARWWADLGELVQRFMRATDAAQERQIERLLQPLHDWHRTCADAALDTPLPLLVVREHWLAQLDSAGLHQRFFGGGVQFATLMPMRAIPFRVVALLGMNDGDYPRSVPPRDFDLMARQWRPGDRSRREDDRYLFLEALLSARERLCIGWQARRITDNAERPPSVLVAQLIDHLRTTWGVNLPQPLHPLQPFSARYTQAGSGFQTHDADWAAALVPTARPAVPAAPVSAAAAPPASCTLDMLQRFLRQPVQACLRDRWAIRLSLPQAQTEDDEAFVLDTLERHRLASGLLWAPATPDAPATDALAALRLSGRLPLAGFGQREARALADTVQRVRDRQIPWLQAHPHALDALPVDLGFTLALPAAGGAPHSLQLQGSLAGLRAQSDRPGAPVLLCTARPGAVAETVARQPVPRLGPLAPLWAAHLAGCAHGLALTSVVLGVDGEVHLPPLAAERALALLHGLLQAWLDAWAQPAPVAAETAWRWLMVQQIAIENEAEKDRQSSAEAQKVFEFQSRQQPGEHARHPELQRAFAGFDDIAPHLPHWAGRVYGALARHARVERAEAPATGEPTE